jgi:hypothetical protein
MNSHLKAPPPGGGWLYAPPWGGAKAISLTPPHRGSLWPQGGGAPPPYKPYTHLKGGTIKGAL